MTDRRSQPRDPAAAVREAFRAHDPGAAPLGLRSSVAAVPATIEPVAPRRLRAALAPIFGLAAAVALIVLGLHLGVPLPPGAAPSPSLSTLAFDMTRDGIGSAPPFDEGLPRLFALFAAASLVLLAISVRPWWQRIAAATGAVAVIAYAAYSSFVPVNVGVFLSADGPNVVAATLPPGVDGPLYYTTAAAGQPFAYPVGLLVPDPPAVTVESLAFDQAQPTVGLRWTAAWLDRTSNGGASGPSLPLQPVALDGSGQTLWLVGRTGRCALGRAPAAGDTTSGWEWLDQVRLNITVLGWPRVVTVRVPRIVEIRGAC